jgi:hypothetical protein
MQTRFLPLLLYLMLHHSALTAGAGSCLRLLPAVGLDFCLASTGMKVQGMRLLPFHLPTLLG